MASNEGLLEKAIKLKSQTTQEPESVEQSQAKAANPQEHEDILAHIEKIASQNRIQVSPSLFKLNPRQSGRKLPIIVNLGALVLVSLVLGILYFVFNTAQAAELQEDVTLQSAEGKLLAEIKKQSEAELAEKDKQLKEIEDQLSKVQSERNSLAGNLEDKVKQRETVLKAQMDAILETERQKLRAQGLSEQEVERRIKEIERKKNEEYNAQLATYRKQLDQEKAKAEAELAKLETQFNSQISKVSKDRENLLTEAKSREEELRKQLQAAQQASSSSSNEAQEKARVAQAQIERINQVREQEKNVDQQISGFYNSIRDHLGAKRWTEALSTLDKLGSYLRSPTMAASETLVQKRDKELYTLEILRSYVEDQRAAPSTNELIKNASIITESEALKTQALAEMRAGNRGAAGQTWKTLLERIPGGAEAVAFVREEQIALAEQAKTQAAAEFQSQVEALRTQYAASNNEELTAAMEELTKKYEAQTAALDASSKELVLNKDTLAKIEAKLKKAEQDLSSEKRTTATLTRTTKDLEQSATALQSDVKNRDAEILRLQVEINKLNASLSSSGTESSGDAARLNQEKIARLESQIKDLREENSRLANPVASTTESPEELKIKELEASLAKVKLVEADYNNLLKAYQAYQSGIRNLKPSTSDQDLKSAKRLLENFLNTAEARKALPGLGTAIAAYDKALVDSGKPAGILESTTILWDVINQRDKTARETFVKNALAKEKDPARKDFFESLLNLVK